MRVADRDGTELDGPARQLDAITRGFVLGDHRQRARSEIRHAHRYRHATVILDDGVDEAARTVQPQLALAATAPLRHEPGDAACAVAALLDLDTVGVEDAVIDVRAGAARRLEHQGLVEPDPGSPVGERAELRLPSAHRRRAHRRR